MTQEGLDNQENELQEPVLENDDESVTSSSEYEEEDCLCNIIEYEEDTSKPHSLSTQMAFSETSAKTQNLKNFFSIRNTINTDQKVGTVTTTGSSGVNIGPKNNINCNIERISTAPTSNVRNKSCKFSKEIWSGFAIEQATTLAITSTNYRQDTKENNHNEEIVKPMTFKKSKPILSCNNESVKQKEDTQLAFSEFNIFNTIKSVQEVGTVTLTTTSNIHIGPENTINFNFKLRNTAPHSISSEEVKKGFTGQQASTLAKSATNTTQNTEDKNQNEECLSHLNKNYKLNSHCHTKSRSTTVLGNT